MKPTQKTLTEFRKVFISKIHGLPYGEAIKKERKYQYKDFLGTTCYGFLPFSISIGRVMQGLRRIDQNKRGCSPMSWVEYHFQADLGRIESFEFIKSQNKKTKYQDILIERIHICNWKLTKNNFAEATEEDQTEETLLALINLLK